MEKECLDDGQHIALAFLRGKVFLIITENIPTHTVIC